MKNLSTLRFRNISTVLLVMLVYTLNAYAQGTLSLTEVIDIANHYYQNSTSENKTKYAVAIVQAKRAAESGTEEEQAEAAKSLQSTTQEYVMQAQPTNGIAFDMTFKLQNADVRTSTQGWTGAATTSNYVSEFWNQTFDFNQVLTDMPSGVYQLKVTGFYRNGEYTYNIRNEANAGCSLYGNSVHMPLMRLYDETDAAVFSNRVGGYADGMSDANNVFSQGYYDDNEVLFSQDETGLMTVGIRNQNSRYSNWACFRDFKLSYLGKQVESGTILSAVRISSPNYRASGAIVPGESVNQNTPIYGTNSLLQGGKANYWYVRQVDKKKMALQNAATGGYITYDGQRTDGSYIRRYLTMTETMVGDSSLWTFTWDSNGYATIRNVKYPVHLFDLRTDSYVLGTYERAQTANNNQVFGLYDAFGSMLTSFNTQTFNKSIIQWTLNDRNVTYDRASDSYLFSIPDDILQEGNYAAELKYTLAAGVTELRVNGEPVTSGAVYSFDNVDYGTVFNLALYADDDLVAESQLTFTSLPIVEIKGNFGTEYTEATIRVDDPNGAFGADTLIRSRIKWRGATTRNRKKKQYAVKLYDVNGESTDVSFFGLRSDNNWILDGMVIDKARMRNRVVTDMWNDFAVKPYYFAKEPKALTGTRGRFVELMLNGEYVGIYCMTEKMDRKQMKLKKYDEEKAGTAEAIRGQLYKASDWSYSVFMGHYSDNSYYPMTSPVSFNNNSETWDSYEVKYPDLGDGQPVDWRELYNAVDLVASASDRDFSAMVGTYFDIPTIIDYYILMDVILSADNHGKNMYWGIYNRNKSVMMTPGLWDLDSTCGRRWDASAVTATHDYTYYITYYEHGDFNLFRRLKACNVDNFNELIRYRYKELRQGALHTDSILARFYDYKELFDRSGAGTREEERWTNTDIGEINFDNEMEYLTTWFNTRMSMLDDSYDIASLPDPTPDGIQDVSAGNIQGLKAYAEAGTLVVECNAPQLVAVYTLGGELLKRAQVMGGKTYLGQLPKGIYLVNRQRVIIH